MADEAFALSPISARAALPSEEDYAAIAEAFMETSRGRWFLTEYAKRNRNADTRMVLDAVSRIEQSLTAQKEESRQREESLRREDGLSAQQAAEAVAAAAAAQERLTEALAAIRGAVEAAEESAVEALDSLALDQRLAPVRKGARVLREIAWRLREIGNDGRICDLIDSQVTVIERGTEQFSSEDARAALRAAFAALQGRLVEVEDEDASPVPLAETDAMAPFSAAQDMPATGTAETFVAPEAEKAAETPFTSETPFTALARSAEAALAAAEAGLKAAEARQAAEAAAAQDSSAQDTSVQDTSVQDTSVQDAAALQATTQDNATQDNSIPNVDVEDPDAQDEALLDIIAMEMGAPDPISDAEIAEAIEEQIRSAEPTPVAPKAVAEAPQPTATPAPPPVQQVVQPPPPPAAAPAPAPAMEVSLGSTLIASGMLRKPVSAANDPLAPIRRMSQAEKIAFFS
ncbi:hypothetical protein ACH79_41850 [Bradyrhizobium sp. CCBAU 051011]|uniref:hypothetical protein n=1 Tax=Bradyrhizobium sp. CCBAU 051011 TaxID=858422 RepID=UPI001373987C|nr:hypothetical protein [Bradyrhizobium sp. CCBAU 051011]QHO79436.1 hypothetical protein ACH79_41850 [Bradyrhizobium sp. CCBAU 051011]